MNKDTWYEYAFPASILALVLLLVLVVVATAKDITFPVAESNCGSLGNVISVIQHLRNQEVPIDAVRKMLKDSSDACVKENGPENCILQDKEGQDMLDAMMEAIWKAPPQDPGSFGMAVYTHCLKANKGKVL